MNHLFIPRSLFIDDSTIHMHNFGGAHMTHGTLRTWQIYSRPCDNKLASWPAVMDDFGTLVAVQ